MTFTQTGDAASMADVKLGGEPVPAYQDPAIEQPVDMEQHLKLVDLKTAVLRAKLAVAANGGCETAIRYADNILREVGYFRLRYEEITR
jgi:hypothetical protein